MAGVVRRFTRGLVQHVASPHHSRQAELVIMEMVSRALARLPADPTAMLRVQARAGDDRLRIEVIQASDAAVPDRRDREVQGYGMALMTAHDLRCGFGYTPAGKPMSWLEVPLTDDAQGQR
jgi:hypothetical protein